MTRRLQFGGALGGTLVVALVTLALHTSGNRVSVVLVVLAVAAVGAACAALLTMASERRARLEQERAQEQLRLITDALPVLISYVDRSERYRFVNQTYGEWFGTPRDTIIGRRVAEVVGEEAYGRLRANIAGALAGRRIEFDGEVHYRTGGTRHIHATYLPDVSGSEVRGYVALVADVTERRRAEQVARESAAMLDLALNAGGMGSWDWDLVTGALRWSRGHFTLLGLDPDTVSPSTEVWRARVHPDDEAQQDQRFALARETQTEYRTEHRIVRPDGTVRWVESRGHFVYDASGQARRSIGVIIDITERRLAEDTRERVLREAETANRLKDEFLATLSHELRTPLNAITGWVRMLRTRPDAADLRDRALDVIDRNVKLQTQLVEDVLDVSRVIAGKLRLDVQSVDLRGVVEAAVDVVRPAAEARRIRLDVDRSTDVCGVRGDPDRLQQVVWNLLSNAIKFTPVGGGVAVTLGESGGAVEITVRDSGIGIAPAFLPFVFERFRQADSRYSREYGGLGLGLAITRHLVELHGGTVRASSEGEGRGAVFTVTLPLLAREEAQAARPVRPEKAVSRLALADRSLDDLRILLVDDDRDARELLAVSLEGRKATVVAVASGAEALAALDTGTFDVLVSDVGMPVMDGFELLRRVRQRPPERGGAIPAAAVTAYARPEDRTRALLVGFQLHLAKPADPDELVAVVLALARPRHPEIPA